MIDTADLIRKARLSCGLTQDELARKLHTTQSAVARLERRGGTTTVKTLERVMAAVDKELVVNAVDHRALVDETLIASNLLLSPSDRLDNFARYYDSLRGTLASSRLV